MRQAPRVVNGVALQGHPSTGSLCGDRAASLGASGPGFVSLQRIGTDLAMVSPAGFGLMQGRRPQTACDHRAQKGLRTVDPVGPEGRPLHHSRESLLAVAP